MRDYIFKFNDIGFSLIQNEDVDYLIKIDCDSEVREFFPDGVVKKEEIPERISKYKSAYDEYGYGCYLVFDLKTNNFIGRAGIGDLDNGETEIGYLITKELWNKGYATKILMALLDWCKRNLKKKRVIAFTPVEHKASERVMQKAGMTFLKIDIMKGVNCVIYEYKLK